MENKNPLYAVFSDLEPCDPNALYNAFEGFVDKWESGELRRVDSVNQLYDVLVDNLRPYAVPVHYAAFVVEQDGKADENHYVVGGYRRHVGTAENKLELFEINTLHGFRQIAFIDWEVLEQMTLHNQEKHEAIKLLTSLAQNIGTVEMLTLNVHQDVKHRGPLYWGLISTWIVDDQGVTRIAIGHPDDADRFHGPPVTTLVEGVDRQRGMFISPPSKGETARMSAPPLTATSWTPAERMPKSMHTAWKTARHLPELVPEVMSNPAARVTFGISGGEEGYAAGIVSLRVFEAASDDGMHLAMLGAQDISRMAQSTASPVDDRTKLN